MTLPGGPADKLGNRYEKLWTISEIVKMLMGFSDSIRIEDPAVQKAEFVVTKSGLREFHQTKRVNQSGKWSLAALAAKDNGIDSGDREHPLGEPRSLRIRLRK